MVINLFNELQGSKTINGTWANAGGTTPAPAPPGTYNGTIDLTGYTDGTYRYSYTVTLSGKTDVKYLSIPYVTPSDRSNEVCTNALPIFYNNNTGGYQDQYNYTDCTDLKAPAASIVALPANWTAASYSGDLWYKLTMNKDAFISLTIDSTGFNNGMINPAVAIYISCSTTLVTAVQGINNLVNIDWTHIGVTPETYYIRVACPIGKEGKFNLSVVIQDL